MHREAGNDRHKRALNETPGTARRLRILFADSVRVWGGAQRFVLESATRLASRGHRVVVQTYPGTPLAQRARECGLPVKEVSTRADAAPWTVLPLAAQMLRHPYDVLVTTWDKDLRTAGLAAKLCGRRTLIIHTRECDDRLKNRLRHRWFYNRVADHILVNSEATLATTLRSAPWLDRNRTSILYKGIELRDYESLHPETWRKQMDPNGDRVVIGYAGQLIDRKRIDVLMRALSAPEVMELPWHLAIAGLGPAEEHLREEARRLGIERRVSFCGFVDALHDWMAAIDIFVLPSLIEGFGYVLAEAGAAGKPSVAYRASSVPEVVIDGETALLAESGDDIEFGRHLKRLITDSGLRQKMGAAARQDVFRRHGLDAMVERMEARMFELLDRIPR
ncbi:MAG: glycosyltransferase family 4 protein [Candidatus Krumholzibacteria bacterium]